MRILVLVLFSGLAFSAFGQTEKLIVSTYQYADNNRLKNIAPFADYLSKTCGCTTELKSYESVGAMLAGMRQEEPSIVFMNTFGYFLLREQNNSYGISAALQVAPGKKSTYQSVIVVNKNTGITTLEELSSRAATLSLLLVNPGSTSGNLVPRIGLASVGIREADSVFKKVAYSKNHALTLKQVAEGKADVGAFGSEEYDKLTKMEPSLMANVTLLWTSHDIPLGPVMHHKSINKKLRSCINDALLSLHEKNNAVLEAIKAGWTEAIPADRYIKVSDHEYESWLKKNGNLDLVIPIIKKFGN